MVELLLALALVLLFSAWFASFVDRRVRLGLIPLWRRVIAWGGLLLLSGSFIELLYCFTVVSGSVQSVNVVLSLFETGLVFVAAGFLTGWFGSRKTLACSLPCTLLVGISWFLLLSRVA
jgi:hypothetical protein